MNIIEILKEGASKLWKNPSLLFPQLITLLINYVLLGFFLLIVAVVFGASIITSIFNQEALTQALTDLILANLVPVVIMLIILFILDALVSVFFDASLLTMLNSKKPSFKEIFSGKKFFGRILVFDILFMLAIILMGAIVAGIFALVATTEMYAIIIPAVLLLIVFALLLPLISLSAFYIVMNNSSAMNGIKKSIHVVKKNYLMLLGLLLLLILILIAVSSVLGMIPVVGSMISAILIQTYLRACLNIFAVEKGK